MSTSTVPGGIDCMQVAHVLSVCVLNVTLRIMRVTLGVSGLCVISTLLILWICCILKCYYIFPDQHASAGRGCYFAYRGKENQAILGWIKALAPSRALQRNSCNHSFQIKNNYQNHCWWKFRRADPAANIPSTFIHNQTFLKINILRLSMKNSYTLFLATTVRI